MCMQKSETRINLLYLQIKNKTCNLVLPVDSKEMLTFFFKSLHIYREREKEREIMMNKMIREMGIFLYLTIFNFTSSLEKAL